ncbi:MAG: hypothetical protein AAGJ87_07820 [Pseudomonadota bacterium]
MGHHISAIITKQNINQKEAEILDLPIITECYATIIPLNSHHCDHWLAALNISNEHFSSMVGDSSITHIFAKRLGITKFAIVETEYFGGVGEQCAALYENGARLLDPETTNINTALKALGVERRSGKDEFDTINLGAYRFFDDLFEKYWR